MCDVYKCIQREHVCFDFVASPTEFIIIIISSSSSGSSVTLDATVSTVVVTSQIVRNSVSNESKSANSIRFYPDKIQVE